jgi:hypothetical protein
MLPRVSQSWNRHQTEAEATAEDAFEESIQAFVEIPNDLLPEVRSLIAKHQTRN